VTNVVSNSRTSPCELNGMVCEYVKIALKLDNHKTSFAELKITSPYLLLDQILHLLLRQKLNP
jgi:hypothetical protein